MLQNIRDNAQGTIAKVIVGLIVITFALFGVESIVGGLSGEPEVASVNGESVTEYQFQQQLERRRRQLINQMGENYDPSLVDENLLRAATLEDIITTEVQRQVGENKGLTVSEDSIDQFILSWPPAQVDGRFNREQFQVVLRNIGLSPLDFRRELRSQLMLSQLRSAIVQTSFVLDSELEELLRIERQQRTFHYLELNAEDIAKNVVPEATAIRKYYEDNQSEFELPERVRLDYIAIRKDDLLDQVVVDDSEIQTRYEQEIAGFSAEEQRRSSHILLEISDDVDQDAVLKKAKDIKSRIDGGESFADLAKEYSDDIGSAQQGGDLGFVNQGSLGQALDDVLFAMETGEVSAPVLSEFGYHILKLDEVSSVAPPELAEAEARIREGIQGEKAEDLFVEMSAKLADLTYSAADLAGPASELGFDVITSNPITRSGLDGDDLFSNPSILNQAFSEDVLEGGHNSEVVEINRDTLVVVRKNEYLPAQVQAFEDVEADISAKLALQEAKRQLAEKTAELIDKAVAGQFESFEGKEWSEAENVTRNQPDYGQATVHAFTLPKPASGVVADRFETDTGYILVALTDVVEAEMEALSEQEKRAFRAFLSNQVGTQEYSNFTGQLQSLAEIDRI